MADLHKYKTHELLSKVLNAGEDALNVDIDNVTLTTEGGDVAIDVALDKANDSVTVYANTAADGSGTSTVPLVDAAGHVQVDIISSALPSGGATAANQSTIIGHVDGIETLLTGIDADTDAIKTAVQILDDWDDSNYANVNINLAGSDAPTGGGGESGALRVTIANDSTGVVSVDDGGGALTVDGTVTANLSATDNAVLDTIDATLDNMLYGNALDITAIHGGSGGTGTQDLSGTYEALYIGVGGDVVVTMVGTGNFTFKNVASGQLLPIRITHVIHTNTTATNMIALKA